MGDALSLLLLRLIAADREYWLAKVAGRPCSPDDRGVEVGWINSVNPRTAKVLEDAGLIECVEGAGGNTYAYLGRYDPLAPVVVPD